MSYKYINGYFATTACIRSKKKNKNYFVPKQNKTYSENLLFGIAGGIGIGYILWNYKSKNRKQLSLHFHNHWGKETRTMTELSKRIGLDLNITETTSSRKAYNNLRVTLDKGDYIIVWVDRNKLPYNFEPLDKYEKTPHPVVITNFNKETNIVTVDDLAKGGFELTMDELKIARRNIPSLKNCSMQIKGYKPIELLSRAVVQGIDDFIEKISTTSQSFSLPALKKWAKLLASPANKKSWSIVFADNTDLFTTLAKVYENTTLYCKDGHGLRYMYADFLDEASYLLNIANLKEIATVYRKAGDLWAKFANTTLSDNIAEFKQTKQLLKQKHKALNELGEASHTTLKTSSKQIQELYKECANQFPLNRKQKMDLYNEMAMGLMEIYQVELNAANLLFNTINDTTVQAFRAKSNVAGV